jgi:hypothetical protein
MKLLGKTNRLGGTACHPVQDGSGSPTGRTQTPGEGFPFTGRPEALRIGPVLVGTPAQTLAGMISGKRSIDRKSERR